MRESIVQLFLFVAVVSVTALFVGTIIAQSAGLADSIGSESDRSATALETDVSIVNDPETDAYDPTAADGDGGVVLYVKNTGSATLDPTALDVLLDGEYVASTERNVVDGDRWRVGTVLAVTISTDLDSGIHRVLVRAHDTEDSFTFEHA